MSQALTDLQAAVAKLTTDVQALIAKETGSVSAADVETQVTALNAVDASIITALGQ